MNQVLDFVPIWTLILGMAVFFYVLLDGFDLGVGILFGLAPDTESRNTIMNSIAPIWDGNETWLVLGGLGLLAAFPVAFAIIIPAVYFPILVMLLALVFRGVAFEFRFRDATHKTFWDHAFNYGSGIATFAQGVVLGSFIQGFEVQGRVFSGHSFDFLTPFSLMTGVALLFGYGLLGAGWLILKTEGGIQDAARRHGRVCLIGVLAAVAHRQHLDAACEPRRRRALVQLAEHPDPGAGAGRNGGRRMDDMAGAGQPGRSAAVRRRDLAVCPVLYRHRHQPVPDDRALPFHALGGRLLRPDPGVPAGRHIGAAAGDPDVQRMVLLGIPRQGAVGYRLSLIAVADGN